MKRRFLFRCDKCQMIVSAEFEDFEEIEKVQEDKLVLECLCGQGHCKVLRD